MDKKREGNLQGGRGTKGGGCSQGERTSGFPWNVYAEQWGKGLELEAYGEETQ